MKLTNEQIQAILDGAPDGAIEYCLYEYGGSTCPIYLNCENQFYGDVEKEWVDILLIDNYLHRRRRLSDLREILELRQEIERMKAQQSEVAARAVEDAINNMIYKVANSYEGDDIENPWYAGANHIFKLFVLERQAIFKRLREQSNEL